MLLFYPWLPTSWFLWAIFFFFELEVWAQTMTLVWINVCSGCWGDEEEALAQVSALWFSAGLLIFRPLSFSISLSLFSWPLARSWTPSQIQMSLVPAERLRASTRLIFLPRLLIPQLCSVFKTLRFLLGASNREYTVTGEEKEEKERASVTRYQWNQIYLTCPWATFIFQVDWTDYVECSGSEM